MTTGFKIRFAISRKKEMEKLERELTYLQKLLNLFKKLGHLPKKDEEEL